MQVSKITLDLEGGGTIEQVLEDTGGDTESNKDYS